MHVELGAKWPQFFKEAGLIRLCYVCPVSSNWCAHQLLWQNMEAPVSIFQESPLTEEPRERLFHIHSVYRYQLCTKHVYPSTSLWKINGWNLYQQLGIIHCCYLFRCWTFNDVQLNIGGFCAPCIVEGSALSFADGAAEVLHVQVQILYCLLYMARRASRFIQSSVTHTRKLN